MRRTEPGKPAATEFMSGGGELGALMRAKDWSRTPVGAVESWPQSLRTAVQIMLGSRYAMWMGWGDDLTFFCNDAYRPTLGVKQPWALGASAREVWREIWPDIGPRIQSVLSTGQASASFIQRRMRVGYPRAARMIEIMEEDGILGPSLGGRHREIRVKRSPFQEDRPQ